jgi:hypothetical protein
VINDKAATSFIAPYRSSRLSTLLCNPDQLGENWRAKARDSIPAFSSRKPSRVTSTTNPLRDIGEGLITLAIEPRVQEAERSLARRDECVVGERDDGRHEGARRASSGDDLECRIPYNFEVEALGSNVGVCAPVCTSEIRCGLNCFDMKEWAYVG